MIGILLCCWQERDLLSVVAVQILGDAVLGSSFGTIQRYHIQLLGAILHTMGVVSEGSVDR